jgi:para-aminobenzoate synthetase/4-amino-4-deoxychorismate lyase
MGTLGPQSAPRKADMGFEAVHSSRGLPRPLRSAMSSGHEKAMFRTQPFLLFDDARLKGERLALYCDPFSVITASTVDEAMAALQEVEAARRAGHHVAGYASYELGYALEPRLCPLMPQTRGVPLLWFGVFGPPQILEGERIAEWFAAHVSGRAYAGPLELSESLESYAARFTHAERYIDAGDIYQVNLTFPARFAFAGDPLALYARLRGEARAGHGAFVYDGTRHILSLSPELFFEVKAGVISARPMKGTAPRGQSLAEDDALRTGLAASEKDRAENLMIVDLIRNDLGRIAGIGSVRVPDLYRIETYPTVHQMVSTVKADLKPGITADALFRAVFPCGSVTGAPKIRAMEIIRELEARPRDIYCGAIGAFASGGDAAFNVVIRTLTIIGGEGRLDVGGGVVADSTAGAEYEECLVKARFFEAAREPLSLLETLRFTPGEGFLRGPLHLARLEASARALGIAFDRRAVVTAMEQAVAGAAGPLRVRIELTEDGWPLVSVAPFVPPGPDTVWRFAISSIAVRSGDAFQRHKTVWRQLYESERAAALAEGRDEVLFLNERGEIAEGSMTNVFLRLDGRLVTPPLASGALDGVLRRDLLLRGEAEERVLMPEDLARAEAIWFGNSLRGLIPGKLLTPS